MTEAAAPTEIRVLALLGSLRAKSLNRLLLNAALAQAPQGLVLTEAARLDALPHFNQDLEDAGEPEAVVAFKAALAAAQAVLVVSPEYNSGPPGVLKNAIDWGSRGKNPWRGMPVALMSASPGMLGGVKMQAQLRASFAGVGALVLPAPDVLVGQAANRFDAEGRLADETTRGLIAAQLARLGDFARTLGR
jgi:chromate reductase